MTKYYVLFFTIYLLALQFGLTTADNVTNNEELNKILDRAETNFEKEQQDLNVKKKREDKKKKLESEIKQAANKAEEMNKFETEFKEYVSDGIKKLKEISNEAKEKIDTSSASEDDKKKALEQLEKKKNSHEAQLMKELHNFIEDINAIRRNNGVQIPNNEQPNEMPHNNPTGGEHPIHPEFGIADEQEIYENENPRAKPPRMPNCGDDWDMDHCEGQINLCKNRAYYRLMKRNCMLTCGHCILTTFVCKDRFPPDCTMWGQPFCESKTYTKGMKIKQCAKTCNLC